MNKKLIFGALTIPSLFSGASYSATTDPRFAQKPNVVFIFADDVSYDCLGALNRDEIHTPNLDRLMGESTHFTHAFNQGAWNGAVSAASRAMLITGKYLWNAAVHNPYVSELNRPGMWAKGAPRIEGRENVPFETTWPEYMKEAGYDTYMTGKWHVRLGVKKVFDTIQHVRGGMAAQSQDCYDRNFIEGKADKWTPYDTTYGGYWKGGVHWSEVLCSDAQSYISEASRKSNPFFMYLAFNAPHDPRQSPKRCLDMYDTDQIIVPENYQPLYPYASEMGCDSRLRDEKLAPFPRTEYSIRVTRQEYFSILTHLDEQIGKILDALEASGKLDNTYIIFTADHGLAVGDHGLLGKQNMYDASMRVPLLISGPGIQPGLKIDNMVYMQDIMATVLDLAGSDDGVAHSDFASLLPLIVDPDSPSRHSVYGSYLGLQRMIRTDRYKMIIYPNANVVRLYDMESDPYEMVDLARERRYVKTMRGLFSEFQQLQKDMGGDPLDVTPYFEAYMQKQFGH